MFSTWLIQNQTEISVQIFNADGFRLPNKTIVTFEERAKGAPEAVRTWFQPGDSYGQEFVYPKVKAVELAKANNKPVLATPALPANKQPTVAEMKKAPVVAVNPKGREVEVAQAATPKNRLPPVRLPPRNTGSFLNTASPLPLMFCKRLVNRSF
jgi:hypothetical protein